MIVDTTSRGHNCTPNAKNALANSLVNLLNCLGLEFSVDLKTRQCLTVKRPRLTVSLRHRLKLSQLPESQDGVAADACSFSLFKAMLYLFNLR